MPIYEYKCDNCDNEFELFHTTSGDEAVECPSCHSREPKKLFSTFSSSSNENVSISNSNTQGFCGGSCGCN